MNAQELMDKVSEIENTILDRIKSINKNEIIFEERLSIWDGHAYEITKIDNKEEVFHFKDYELNDDVVPFEEVNVDVLLAVLRKLEELELI